MQEHTASISPLTAIEPATLDRSRVLDGAIAIFTVTMFAGAGLLFLVQPMFAKLALPRLGGSPSVWNTCVLFFQATLLLGYLYAHLSTRWLSIRRQVYAHVGLLITPLIALPLSIGDGQPPASGNPAWWLLGTMTLTVGLPFFVVSTAAPLLQRWFATLPLPSARDPYFLYAASNLGSMLALLAYPLLIEPAIGTQQQTWLWTAGYVVFLVLTAACALIVRAFATGGTTLPVIDLAAQTEPLSVRRRLWWMTLSFIPSSLMLGVTTHISTDIAAVPLLWVLPLAMYLGTFVLAFSTRVVIPQRWLNRLLPVLIFASLCTILVGAGKWWLIPLHLVTFFVSAMVCHRELALRRPEAQRLTEFYIWMSFGGMLGGVFNSLIAPQLFSSILEYPLVLALAALAGASPRSRASRREPIGLVLGVPVFVLILCLGLWATGLLEASLRLHEIVVTWAIVFMALSLFARRSNGFATMSLVSVGLIAAGFTSGAGTVLFEGRSFFGVHRVVEATDHSYHILQHGSTTHGRQDMPADARCEPTGYYHRSNPIGQLLGFENRFKSVAVVGLGAGGLACYAQSGDEWTFYEIDPLIEQIARDPRYFTHLQNSHGRLDVVLGDGRLALQNANPGAYDLILLDAFSSDAIPVHLLTREAFDLYLSRVRSDGVVAVHISNRYLNLEPVLAALARGQGVFALANLDLGVPEAERINGRMASHWVLLSRRSEPLANLAGRSGWHSPSKNARVKPWTDDYSNILQTLVLR